VTVAFRKKCLNYQSLDITFFGEIPSSFSDNFGGYFGEQTR